MAHTNISVPRKFYMEHNDKDLKIALLETELKYFKDRLNQVTEEFSTIPEAIEEHGYVDLYNKEDGVDMRLKRVKKEGD